MVIERRNIYYSCSYGNIYKDSTPGKVEADGEWVKYADHLKAMEVAVKKAFKTGQKDGYRAGYQQAIINF